MQVIFSDKPHANEKKTVKRNMDIKFILNQRSNLKNLSCGLNFRLVSNMVGSISNCIQHLSRPSIKTGFRFLADMRRGSNS